MTSTEERTALQGRVNAAAILLVLAEGQAVGLASGLKIDRSGCHRAIQEGEDAGVTADVDEWRFIIAQVRELERRRSNVRPINT